MLERVEDENDGEMMKVMMMVSDGCVDVKGSVNLFGGGVVVVVLVVGLIFGSLSTASGSTFGASFGGGGGLFGGGMVLGVGMVVDDEDEDEFV